MSRPVEPPDAGRDALRYDPLARTAADWIAAHVISGDIKPGEKLTEVRLAERMGVSRSPVREALQALSRESLITVEKRRGAWLGALDASAAADLYECRMLIEPRCAAIAVGALTDTTTAELDVTLKRTAASVAGRDPMDYVGALKHYNGTLLGACPNRVLAGLAQSSWRSSLRYWDLLVRGSGNCLADSLALNERLHVALCKRSAAETEQAVIDLLEHGRHELLRLLEHLADGAGRAASSPGGAG